LGRLYAYGQNAINNELKIRGYLLYTIERPSDVDLCLDNTQLYRFPMLAYEGNKFLLDGQPPTSYTYEAHPGPSWNMPTWNYDSLEIAVKRLHRGGRQCSFHVMGDAAIDMALDAIEAAQNDTLIPDIRHRLEHVMIPTYESLQRMKELDVLVCMQPAAIYTGGEFYHIYWGPERMQRLMPLRSMIDTGLHVSLGSDYPTVPSLDPRLALWSAIERETTGGYVINENESITIQEALYAHTIEAAYAAHEEDIKGSIEVGKYADLTVWTDNLYEQEVDDILDNEIVMTIVGGTIQGPAGIHDHQQTQDHRSFSLDHAVPNPFTHFTEIHFHVHESETSEPIRLKLAVYNILGEKVITLAEQKFAPGNYKYYWNGTDDVGNRLNGTIYFVKLTSGRHAEVERVIMVGE
jgi:predicted amidohydrolase YtcJ